MIRDKSILIKNIYHMLSYAFTDLNQGDYRKLASEKFDNVHNLFAAILVKGISRQLKQGLYREYLDRIESVTTMRGKIDVNGTIKSCVSRKRMLMCEYDELSENNLLNQILKTTLMILLKNSNVSITYKTDLKKELMFFSSVDTLDPTLVHWNSIRFNKNNKTYRLLINICRLVLEGLLLTTDTGEYELSSFIDQQQMNRLYEKFILEYYVKEQPDIKTSASHIPWSLDDDINSMLPIMRSDVILSKENKILIIDAKYYTHTMQMQYGVHTIHSNNLYQIFTYVKNKDAQFRERQHEVSGMILYARTDESIQPDMVYHMSGNKISVKTLDLNKNFSDIKSQLNLIVEDHFYNKINSFS